MLCFQAFEAAEKLHSYAFYLRTGSWETSRGEELHCRTTPTLDRTLARGLQTRKVESEDLITDFELKKGIAFWGFRWLLFDEYSLLYLDDFLILPQRVHFDNTECSLMQTFARKKILLIYILCESYIHFSLKTRKNLCMFTTSSPPFHPPHLSRPFI